MWLISCVYTTYILVVFVFDNGYVLVDDVIRQITE